MSTATKNEKASRAERRKQRQDLNTYTGKFEMLPVNHLHIEPLYQRQKLTSHIKSIVDDFRWRSFGALSVVRRPDKHYMVIDGQQRLTAAKQLKIKHVPCIVFGAQHVQEEALSFVDTNVNRKNVTALDKFAAQVIAGDELCCTIQSDIENLGYKISAGGSAYSVSCVTALQRMYRQNAEVGFEVLDLLVDIADGTCIKDRVLRGLFSLEMFLRKRNLTLLVPMHRKKLKTIGQPKLYSVCLQAQGYYDRSGAAVWSAGIAKELNKNRRRNNIPSPMDAGMNDDDGE